MVRGPMIAEGDRRMAGDECDRHLDQGDPGGDQLVRSSILEWDVVRVDSGNCRVLRFRR